MKRFGFLILFVLFLGGASASTAQEMWKYFTPEDFAARRAALMDTIGDAVAVFLGAELPEAYVKFRQDNNFYYFTGVETPDAYLVVDGKDRTSRLLVPEFAPGDIKREARIEPGKDAAALYRVDEVLLKKELTATLDRLLTAGRTVWLYRGPEETAEMSPDRSKMLRSKRKNDSWDGRLPRESVFENLVRAKYPGVVVKDLSPAVHAMRWVKDQKEIAVLRECGRIGALGFNEAMKVTRPGLYEYQMVAACDFYYQYNGAQNPAYFAIAASGERGLDWHYNANNHPMAGGDVVLLDYAPDLNYYCTDITRTWPVSGKFSDDQRKMYACIAEFREKAIAALKPGVTADDLLAIGQEVYAKHGYDSLWPNYAGHFVGMAVHDVGPRDRAFVPGVVFNLEPIIEDKTKKVHLRLEDTIVITKDGAEVLTGLTPVGPEEIEKLISEKGIFE
jgi:Xaa-Pro aminopeptidase